MNNPADPGPTADPRADRIDAYLAGDMSASDRAAFERDLAADPTLARDLAAWRAAWDAARDWAQAAPPGLARADAITLASLESLGSLESSASSSPDKSYRSHRSYGLSLPRVWRPAAAAALLLAGFALGRLSQPAAAPDRSISSVPTMPSTLSRETSTAAQPTPQPTPTAVSPVAAPPPANTDLAMSRPAVRTTDENGRLVVETSLQRSGGQATWVIDGSFQIAETMLNR